MKCELSSSGTEKRGKLETSKAIPNTERLTQPTAWSFGNAETLEAPGYCAIFFFNSMVIHTTSVANGEKFVYVLVFFYSKNEVKIRNKMCFVPYSPYNEIPA